MNPYSLAQNAQELGFHAEIILAGRRMNDSMGQYVASEVIKIILQNVVRNTKVVDVVKELQSYGTNITIYDPLANPEEVEHEYGLQTTNQMPIHKFDAVVLAVAHKEFLELDLEKSKYTQSITYDVKWILGEKANVKL